MDINFWEAMIRCGISAWSARSTFDDTDSQDQPVWCYDRFGRTIAELPDGRIVEIAGELQQLRSALREEDGECQTQLT